MRRMGAAVRRRIATVRYRHCAQRPSGPGPAGRPGQSPGPACRGPALGVPGKDRERGAAQPECLSRLPIDGRPGSEANQPVADGSVPAGGLDLCVRRGCCRASKYRPGFDPGLPSRQPPGGPCRDDPRPPALAPSCRCCQHLQYYAARTGAQNGMASVYARGPASCRAACQCAHEYDRVRIPHRRQC